MVVPTVSTHARRPSPHGGPIFRASRRYPRASSREFHTVKALSKRLTPRAASLYWNNTGRDQAPLLLPGWVETWSRRKPPSILMEATRPVGGGILDASVGWHERQWCRLRGSGRDSLPPPATPASRPAGFPPCRMHLSPFDSPVMRIGRRVRRRAAGHSGGRGRSFQPRRHEVACVRRQ